MIDGNQHAARVDAWLRDAPKDIALDELLGRFELLFGAIWRRAHQTLGEVTLTAILDRVLYFARTKYPLVAELELESSGLSCRQLLDRSRELEPDQVALAIRFVLVEFLTLLGNLTAEILTTALHAEFARVAEPAEDRAALDGPRGRQTRDHEGTKS